MEEPEREMGDTGGGGHTGSSRDEVISHTHWMKERDVLFEV